MSNDPTRIDFKGTLISYQKKLENLYGNFLGQRRLGTNVLFLLSYLISVKKHLFVRGRFRRYFLYIIKQQKFS